MKKHLLVIKTALLSLIFLGLAMPGWATVGGVCVGSFVTYESDGAGIDNGVLNAAIARNIRTDYRNIQTVYIGKGIKTIDSYTFEGFISLKNVDFSQATDLVSIGLYAFAELPIETLRIPDNVGSISHHAFYHCDCLTEIHFQGSSNMISIGNYAFTQSEAAEEPLSIELNRSIDFIGDYAGGTAPGALGVFSGSTTLTSLTLGDQISSLHDNTFADCPNLSYVRLGGADGLKRIGEGAFSNCTAIASIMLPDALEKIQSNAFQGCTSLQSIDLPESLKWVKKGAFQGCTSLKTATIWGNPEIEEGAFPSSTDIVYDAKSFGAWAARYDALSTEMFIPNDIIANKGYTNTTNLATMYPNVKKVVFGPQVKTIGANIFRGATKLEDIDTGDGATTIGESAFAQADGQQAHCPHKHITIGKAMTDIPTHAFEYTLTGEFELTINSNAVASKDYTRLADGLNRVFTGARNITFGDEVVCIGAYAFADRTFPLVVNFTKTVQVKDYAFAYSNYPLTVNGRVKNLGKGAFRQCSQLQTIDIESGDIPISCFAQSGLTEIRIPAGITVGPMAFSDCKNLEIVRLPNELKSITPFAFQNCTILKKVYTDMMEPITIQSDVFAGVDLSQATLYVPYDSMDKYQEKDVWNTFGDIFPLDGVELFDGEPYTNVHATPGVTMVRYTRTFSEAQKGNWQSICVPFAIDVKAYKDQFDIAEIFAICPIKDTNDDKVIDADDDVYMIVSRLKTDVDGEVKTVPSLPYLIRPKEAGTVRIEAFETLLASAEEKEISFSTTRTNYTIHGTYSPTVLTPGDNNYYVTSSGELSYRKSSNGTLNPNKWYMHVAQHGYGSSVGESASSAPIRIVALDEDVEESTVIHVIRGEQSQDIVYTLDGVRLYDNERLPAGMYIRNGKKIMIK